jgi:hypothetical protein
MNAQSSVEQQKKPWWLMSCCTRQEKLLRVDRAAKKIKSVDENDKLLRFHDAECRDRYKKRVGKNQRLL